MRMAETQTAAADLPKMKENVWPLLLTVVCFGLLWLEVIKHLRGEWTFNPQYVYGWTVPFLALYLFWKRWSTRPEPSAPGQKFIPITFLFLSALVFLPARFLSEANPDWRLLSWMLSLIAVGISAGCVFLAGGRPWLRHFAFPILFFLVAVPWPTHLEQFVVQNLMRSVTAINVSLLNLAGVPAVQQGNVIEVGAGLIGIEEACSGVRSMQATLMVSLFLGELYSFNIFARTILILAGAGLAFICNLVRTAILVWVGAHKGIKAIESWHDPAGLTILVICLFGLWALSLLMQNRATFLAPEALPLQMSCPRGAHNLVGVAAAFLVWFILAEVIVQSWYLSHRPTTGLGWTINWPTAETEYKTMSVPKEAENLLRYNEGGSGAWHGNDGRQWMMYFFRWSPGRTAALFVKIHRPDICLPASGMSLNRDTGMRLLKISGINLPIRSYRFDDRGTPLHVFYCYVDGRSSYENAKAAEQEDWTMRGRVRAAWQGRRDVGAQMLEMVVWGYENDGEADEALQRELGQIIRPG